MCLLLLHIMQECEQNFDIFKFYIFKNNDFKLLIKNN